MKKGKNRAPITSSYSKLKRRRTLVGFSMAVLSISISSWPGGSSYSVCRYGKEQASHGFLVTRSGGSVPVALSMSNFQKRGCVLDAPPTSPILCDRENRERRDNQIHWTKGAHPPNEHQRRRRAASHRTASGQTWFPFNSPPTAYRGKMDKNPDLIYDGGRTWYWRVCVWGARTKAMHASDL